MDSPSMMRRASLVVALALTACSVPADLLEGRPCPCIEGWVCQRPEEVCVRPGADGSVGDLGPRDLGPGDSGAGDLGPGDLGRDFGPGDMGAADGGSGSAPLLHFTCDSVTASAVPDVSGNGNDGTCLGGCPSLIPDGPVGSACHFPGDRTLEVAAPLGSPLTPASGSSFSLALWFRVDAARFGSLYGRAFDTETANTFEFYVTPSIDSSELVTPHFWRANSGEGDTWQAPSIPVDEWHHMAAVVDADTATTSVYWDGELLMVMPGVAFMYDDHPILVAGDENRGIRDNRASAGIDEVLFYGRALSADEVAALATPR